MGNNCRITVNDSEVIATVLLYKVVLKFGTPKRFITDNGSNLTSEVMNAIVNTLQTRHATTSVEHPQTDGLVERLNRTLKTSLAAYVEDQPDTWDDKLPFVIFYGYVADEYNIMIVIRDLEHNQCVFCLKCETKMERERIYGIGKVQCESLYQTKRYALSFLHP